MAGYRVDPDALIKAAERAADIAGEAHKVDVRSPIMLIASAVPGGRSAAAAEGLGPALSLVCGSWASDLAAHGENLGAATVMVYRESEGAGEAEFESIAARLAGEGPR
ncbi:MAG: hypothetical protein ACRDQ7_18770 [Haloechinothrix sp.]